MVNVNLLSAGTKIPHPTVFAWIIPKFKTSKGKNHDGILKVTETNFLIIQWTANSRNYTEISPMSLTKIWYIAKMEDKSRPGTKPQRGNLLSLSSSWNHAPINLHPVSNRQAAPSGFSATAASAPDLAFIPAESAKFFFRCNYCIVLDGQQRKVKRQNLFSTR